LRTGNLEALQEEEQAAFVHLLLGAIPFLTAGRWSRDVFWQFSGVERHLQPDKTGMRRLVSSTSRTSISFRMATAPTSGTIFFG